MARVAAPAVVQHAGLYEWLREREEDRVARWVYNDGTRFPYPKHRIEAFRAGDPVQVPGWMLPPGVRKSSEYLKHHRRVHPAGATWISQTVTVFPDNRVVYRPQTAGEWLEEHGDL